MQRCFDELVRYIRIELDGTGDHLDEQIETAAKALEDERQQDGVKGEVRTSRRASWNPVDPFRPAGDRVDPGGGVTGGQ